MPITFITLKMVYVLPWTTGDASNLFCQSLYQVHFVYSSMSSGILTQFNNVIRCGTTEKVAVQWPPWNLSFGFMPLPFVALRSGASFALCMSGVILENEWILR
jgi:hypothetical protein